MMDPNTARLRIKPTLCAFCTQYSFRIIKDTSVIANFIKVFFRTLKFDEVIINSHICKTCEGRVHQLYSFFILAIEHRKEMTFASCFTCYDERLTSEYDVSGEIATFLSIASMEKLFPRNSCQLCPSCYAHMIYFNKIHRELSDREIVCRALLDLQHSR